MSRSVMWFASVQFVALLLGSALFLWFADRLPLAQSALWFAVLTACLWAVGAVTQGRISVLEVLLIEAAALATATSVSMNGMPGVSDLHFVLKPLPLAIAMIFVAYCARVDWSKGLFYPLLLLLLVLLLALAASLAGDVLLMAHDQFLAGVAAFLVAQAIGRALVLRNSAATGVAVGAGFFMLSDSLLAIDRFGVALPSAPVWVLASYFTAQILIARHAQPAAAAQGSEPAKSPSLA